MSIAVTIRSDGLWPLPRSNGEVFNATGRKIGDVELTGRYQLNDGGPNEPYYICVVEVQDADWIRSVRFPLSMFLNSGYLPKAFPLDRDSILLQPEGDLPVPRRIRSCSLAESTTSTVSASKQLCR